MYTTLTSPHNLRDTRLRDSFAEMRYRERISASLAEGIYLLARAAWRQCVRKDGDRR